VTEPADDKLLVLTGGDELDTDLAGVAKAAATYRKALLREGIPAALANDLVRSWHAAFWSTNEVED
jgi:hypothetical protein